MIIWKTQIDRIIELSNLTPAEKIVVISLIRRGALTARDISVVTAISPRAVYYALETLINKKTIINNAGIYSLRTDYMSILCKRCKDNARAREAPGS